MPRLIVLFGRTGHGCPALVRGSGFGRTRLLTSLFFRRFLGNDLVAPSGEMHAGAAFVLALLAAPGFFALAWLLFTYSGPFLTPSERLLLSLDHKYQFLACSMIVTALGTTLEWDALSIDARDFAILGSLPVPHAVLWRAKILALLLFVGVFAVAVNLIPTVGFPVVWLSLVPIGFPRALSVVGVHALSSLAAAVFGFCVVIALHSAMRLVCGPRVFRALSPFAQSVFALALLTGFLLMPAWSSNLRTQLRRPSVLVLASPPLWFVGAYERLTARGLYADPDLARDGTWKFWERERIRKVYREVRVPGRLPEAWVHPSPLFRTEADARAKYREIQPTLDGLAARAVIAFCLVALAAATLYFVAHVRGRGWLEHPQAARPWRVLSRRGAGILTTRRIVAAFVRAPVARATYFFTLHTLCRSRTHRLSVAGFFAVGLALSIALLGRAPVTAGGLSTPTSALLSLQFVLAFFLLVGVRVAFALPAALEAAWQFRVTDDGDCLPPLVGAQRAVVAGLLLPLLAVLLPIHATVWGARVAVLHFATGGVCSLLLLELLLFDDKSIPFTCAWVPEDGHLGARWTVYLLALMLFVQGLAALEVRALAGSWAFAAFVTGLLGALIGLRGLRRRHIGGRGIVFDEPPEGAVQTLGLDAV